MASMLIMHAGQFYLWVPGASFIAVWDIGCVWTSEQVPDDMIEIPEWINRARLTKEVLRSLIQTGILAASPGEKSNG